jgi:hypothetical protein
MWYSHWDTVIDWISYATSSCCNAGLFADDFESGDTSAWSVTVPKAAILAILRLASRRSDECRDARSG